MTTVAVRLPVGFAGIDAGEWRRPRGFPRADALERALDALPGVGPVVKKKLERLGLLTVGRGVHGEEAERARRRGAAVRTRRLAPGRSEGARAFAPARRRALGPAPTAFATGGRGRAETTRFRRAPLAADRTGAASPRTGGRDCARARCAGGAGLALPRRSSLRADRAPGTSNRRDRRRPPAHGADAAAAAGRGGLRKDRRRALRTPARGGGGTAGSVDGADRDARGAALPDARGAVPSARRDLCATDELVTQGGARSRADCRHRPRHARPD